MDLLQLSLILVKKKKKKRKINVNVKNKLNSIVRIPDELVVAMVTSIRY